MYSAGSKTRKRKDSLSKDRTSPLIPHLEEKEISLAKEGVVDFVVEWEAENDLESQQKINLTATLIHIWPNLISILAWKAICNLTICKICMIDIFWTSFFEINNVDK